MNKTLLTILAGIGIGLLIAPDKGSVTLKKLLGKFDDLRDHAEDEASDWADKGKDAIKSARDKIAD